MVKEFCTVFSLASEAELTPHRLYHLMFDSLPTDNWKLDGMVSGDQRGKASVCVSLYNLSPDGLLGFQARLIQKPR
eukprot:1243695-Prorocentrum_lima.AAC.1